MGEGWVSGKDAGLSRQGGKSAAVFSETGIERRCGPDDLVEIQTRCGAESAGANFSDSGKEPVS